MHKKTSVEERGSSKYGLLRKVETDRKIHAIKTVSVKWRKKSIYEEFVKCLVMNFHKVLIVFMI